jgi:hypothetical protein
MPFRFRHDRTAVQAPTPRPAPAHEIESDFVSGLCRFTLDCTCGAHWDTPYIDEALEWRELHERLAPLADQLAH